MKILLVDDDKIVRDAVSYLLKSDGCDVTTANDGIAALKMIKREEFHLVICDILMPNLSGFGLIRLFNRFTSTQIPVIFMSGAKRTDIETIAMSLGASGFITKPICMNDLGMRVKKIRLDNPSFG